MKKAILSFAIVAIAAVAAFNVNFNLGENKNLSAIALANVEALAQVEDSDFKYAIDKDKPCNFYVSGEAQVGIVKKWFGITAKVGASVDISDGTALYRLGGVYRLGDDVNCAKAKQQVIDAL